MANEPVSLPGSSNVVSIAYKGTSDDLQQAKLLPEHQHNVDTMEQAEEQAVETLLPRNGDR